jgi:hypothetical protein
MTNRPHVLYLIKRGPKPDISAHWHPSVVWHPVILCTRKHTMLWEAGGTDDGATIWMRPASNDGYGFSLIRWNGFNLVYAGPGRCIRPMPDGALPGCVHPGNPDPRHRGVWDLLSGAVWWSDHDLPEWLAKRGVVLPGDEWTQRNVDEDAGDCLLSFKEQERLADRRDKLAAREPAV